MKEHHPDDYDDSSSDDGAFIISCKASGRLRTPAGSQKGSSWPKKGTAGEPEEEKGQPSTGTWKRSSV